MLTLTFGLALLSTSAPFADMGCSKDQNNVKDRGVEFYFYFVLFCSRYGGLWLKYIGF